jgi:N-acetyl-anhydromuramyl-L-alanine amidase AmpD
MNLRQISFPKGQYFEEVVPKTQIYLHHTAGAPNADQVWQWWVTDKTPIATCVVVDDSGEIVQGFSSKFWAYHLGLKTKHFSVAGVPYKNLDKSSIGIELTNWGQLTQKNGKFYNYVNGEVPASQVCELPTPHRGYRYYHNYTDAQIQSVKELLLLWNEKYNIPLTYNEDIWGISKRALEGKPGVFTHNSVRPDKVDVYPHPKLVEMLKSLS